jgi:selenocysteine lyase/cysteine desulfurase
MPIIPSQRRLFDLPEGIGYFNCAFNSPQLHASLERLLEGARSKSRPWERTPADFFNDAETIRVLAAQVFGGTRDGYAVVPSATYGISTAARAVEPQLQAGDRILVIAEEFPSNVLPWQRVARETGAVVATVPRPDDGHWTRAIVDRMEKRIKVVAISPCHWTDGAFIDLREIGAACRTIGAMLVVDATQALGAMPLSLAEIQPDFLVAAGYKWLLCPYGFALLHVAESWRSARPLEESWLARQHAEDFTALVHYSDTYMDGARRFDMGEKCIATLLPGAIAALEQIGDWGVENIAATLESINARIEVCLEQLGFELPQPGQRCPHMFGAQLSPAHTGKLVADLRERDIYISQRGNALRFSPHVHVSDHDIQRLIAALHELA